MKKSDYSGKKVANLLIKVLICVFKWLCFVLTVCCLGFTIGLIVIYISKGQDIGNSFVETIYSILTGSTSLYANNLIKEIGLNNMVFTTISYGICSVVKYGITYIIMDTINIIYNSIYNKNMFTKDNISKINSIIYLTVILIIVPIIIDKIIYGLTDGTESMSINYGGVIYFCIAYVAKMIFMYGYELEHKVELIGLEEQKLVKKVSSIKKKEETAKRGETKKATPRKNQKKPTKKTQKK